MNIVKFRQEERLAKIANIQQTILFTLESGKAINYKEFVLSVMDNLNLSRRYTKDYIDIALLRLHISRKDLENPATANIFKTTILKPIEDLPAVPIEEDFKSAGII